ncbi:MAG: CDP-alcohol phosphatidyltransferase family protein [Bacteroidetes bacterium]|nr:CDP-alcohol phosphatidyltransferase family protein [Bacteroidota bacterium]
MKTKILHKIPHALLYSRLVVAILIIISSFTAVSPTIIVALSIYAILSDVFDGIIARQLKISTIEMRQLDTKIDTVFWFSCLFYICITQSHFLKIHLLKISILVFSELFIIAFGFLKFEERISYHTIFSKFWALLLLWFFIDLILNNASHYSFIISFWYGIFVQMEILLIAIILKDNQTDVPGFLKAIKLRKGLKISRNRLFNG